jgi:SAM-dependent methyltransferase
VIAPDLLRCPATGAALKPDGDALATEDGSRRYPVVNGVPILIDEEHSVFRIGDFHAADPSPDGTTGWRRLAKRVGAVLPDDSLNVGTRANVERLLELLADGRDGQPACVLVIGGATVGKGLEPLFASPLVDLTETDVWLGPRTRIVCDGHALPFADAAFDAVVCQAVLEHVLDPGRVVSEIHRVLRPNGLVYSEIPFMQQVHEGRYDFTRYTQLGHRRLFREFDDLASNAVCGPGMALAWSIRYLCASLAGGSRFRRAVIERVVPLFTFWLPWLDRRLAATPGGSDAASSTSFLGRRREAPVPDAEVVAGYAGLQGTPQRWG